MIEQHTIATEGAQGLDNLRQSIGRLDEELLKIFAERRKLSLAVAANKLAANRKVRDQAQEKTY